MEKRETKLKTSVETEQTCVYSVSKFQRETTSMYPGLRLGSCWFWAGLVGLGTEPEPKGLRALSAL